MLCGFSGVEEATESEELVWSADSLMLPSPSTAGFKEVGLTSIPLLSPESLLLAPKISTTDMSASTMIDLSACSSRETESSSREVSTILIVVSIISSIVGTFASFSWTDLTKIFRRISGDPPWWDTLDGGEPWVSLDAGDLDGGDFRFLFSCGLAGSALSTLCSSLTVMLILGSLATTSLTNFVRGVKFILLYNDEM